VKSISPPRSSPPKRGQTPLGFSLTAVALALLVPGCGSGEDDDSGDAVGQELGGSVAQLAQCSDWAGATEEQRLATIEDIRSHVNQEDSGVTASVLTDEEAVEVFDRGCERPAAGSFRLYVMYARAAAFKPLREVAEGE
jgi:hypothetical protein